MALSDAVWSERITRGAIAKLFASAATISSGSKGSPIALL
jgi:hypothetical protein